MLHRVGISMGAEEVRRARILQKRFGVRSRSELFRELMKRYERMEERFNALSRCIDGYTKIPESPAENRAMLKATLKHQPQEEWE